MIWDRHCHLTGVPGTTPEEHIAQLMEYADRMGIERVLYGSDTGGRSFASQLATGTRG